MPTFEAGAVTAELHLDRSPFMRSLSAARASAMDFARQRYEATLGARIRPAQQAIASVRGEAQSVARLNPTITIDAAIQQALQKLERAERAGEGLENQKPTIRVGATTGRVISQLGGVTNAARRVDGLNPTVTARSQTARASRDLSGFERQAEGIGRIDPTVKAVAHTAEARAELQGYNQTLRRYSQSWGSQGIRTRVVADIRTAQLRIRQLERQAENASSETHRILMQAETRRAQGRLRALQEVARSVGVQNPTISVGTRGVASSTAALLGLNQIADRLDGYNVRMRGSIDSSLSKALPSALGALELQLAQFKTVATSIAAVTMPVLQASYAALPAVIGGAGAAVASFAIALSQGVAGAAGIATTALVQGLAGGVAQVGGAVGLGGVALYGYAAALRGTWQWVGNLNDTLSSQRSALEGANKNLKLAQERLAGATKGTREYTLAQRGVAIAQEDVRYQQERYNTLLDIATPRMMRLQRRVNDARISMLRFGGTIMHAVAPALFTGMDVWGRYSGRVASGARAMAVDMTRAAQRMIRLAGSGQQLRSISTILGGVRRAGVPALTLVSNAALMLVNILAPLVPHSLRLLRAMSGLAAAGRRWSASAEGQRRIAQVWALLVRQGERLGRVGWNIARILFGVFAPSTRHAQGFLQRLVAITSAGARWVESARGQRRIAAIWETLAMRARWLGRVLGNVGAGMWGVFAALNQSGMVDYVAGRVEALTARFRRLMRVGGPGRNGIVQFARDTIPALRAVESLAVTTGAGLVSLAGYVMSFRNETTGRPVMVEIIEAFEYMVSKLIPFLKHEFESIGPLLPPLIRALTDWFVIFGRAQPEMIFFIGFVTDMLEAFNSLPEPLKILVARSAAWFMALKAIGAFSFIGMIGGLVTTAAKAYILRRAYQRISGQLATLIGQQNLYNAAVARTPMPRGGAAPGRAAPMPAAPMAPAPGRVQRPVTVPVAPATGAAARAGFLSRLGGFIAGLPIIAHIGRAMGRMRAGPIGRALGGVFRKLALGPIMRFVGIRLIGGLLGFLVGPLGWILLAVSLGDMLTGGAISRNIGKGVKFIWRQFQRINWRGLGVSIVRGIAMGLGAVALGALAVRMVRAVARPLGRLPRTARRASRAMGRSLASLGRAFMRPVRFARRGTRAVLRALGGLPRGARRVAGGVRGGMVRIGRFLLTPIRFANRAARAVGKSLTRIPRSVRRLAGPVRGGAVRAGRAFMFIVRFFTRSGRRVARAVVAIPRAVRRLVRPVRVGAVRTGRAFGVIVRFFLRPVRRVGRAVRGIPRAVRRLVRPVRVGAVRTGRAFGVIVRFFVRPVRRVGRVVRGIPRAVRRLVRPVRVGAVRTGRAFGVIVRFFTRPARRVGRVVRGIPRAVRRLTRPVRVGAVRTGRAFGVIVRFFVRPTRRVARVVRGVPRAVRRLTRPVRVGAIRAGRAFMVIGRFFFRATRRVMRILNGVRRFVGGWVGRIGRTIRRVGGFVWRMARPFVRYLGGNGLIPRILRIFLRIATRFLGPVGLVLLIADVVFLVIRHWSRLSRFFRRIPGWFARLARGIGRAVRGIPRFLGRVARSAMRALGAPFRAGGRIISAVFGLARRVIRAGRRSFLNGGWRNLGISIISGIMRGVARAASALYKSMKNIATNALNAAKNRLRSKSPSLEFMELGLDIGRGLILGVRGMMRPVKREARRLAGAVTFDPPKPPGGDGASDAPGDAPPGAPGLSRNVGRNQTRAHRAANRAVERAEAAQQMVVAENRSMERAFREEMEATRRENARNTERAARDGAKVAFAALRSDAGKWLQDKNLLEAVKTEAEKMPETQ